MFDGAKRHTSTALLVVILAFGIACGDGASGNDKVGQVRGTYGLLVIGTKGVPLVAVGLLKAKGNGTVDGLATISFFGTVINETFSGTLMVNGDGTGTLAGTTSRGDKFTKSFVVTDGGDQIGFESTDADEIQLIAARRQTRRGAFSRRSLKGKWAFVCGGTEADLGSGGTAPVTAVGLLANDGIGNFHGHGTYNQNGTVVEATFDGTSIVNSDGTFTDSGTYASGLSGTFADSGVIEDNAQLVTISTSTQGAVSCTLRRPIR